MFKYFHSLTRVPFPCEDAFSFLYRHFLSHLFTGYPECFDINVHKEKTGHKKFVTEGVPARVITRSVLICLWFLATLAVKILTGIYLQRRKCVWTSRTCKPHHRCEPLSIQKQGLILFCMPWCRCYVPPDSICFDIRTSSCCHFLKS